MNKPLTIECTIHFDPQGKGGRKTVQPGPAPKRCEPGRVPRIARLMALALKFDRLIREGKITNYAELARLGQVTRARITQILNLLHLATDIQEALLLLPRTVRGRDRIKLADLQPIARENLWGVQRRLWRAYLQRIEP